MKLQLTNEEKQNLSVLLDLANKEGGLQVAQPCLIFNQRLQEDEFEITEQEAQTLGQLLHIANKRAGLQVAEVCLQIKNRIEESLNAELNVNKGKEEPENKD